MESAEITVSFMEVSDMTLEEIINTYGATDYYEMATGRTFLLSDWDRAQKFFGINLPVSVLQDGEVIGTVTIDTSLLKDGGA